MRLVRKYGLTHEFNTLNNHPAVDSGLEVEHPPQSMSWNSVVKSKVRSLAEQKWLTEIGQMPKLVTYCLIKSTLRLESYLLTETSRQSAVLLTQLRCGTNNLAIDRLRRSVNGVQVSRSDRVCLNCDNDSSVVEDESHVLLDCPRYDKYRQWLHAATLSLSAGSVNLSTIKAEHKLRYLMGTIVSPWLLPEPDRKQQMKLLLAFVYHVMTDHAARTAFWSERRIQVDWSFSGVDSLALDMSISVGSGLGEDEEVVVLD